MSDTLTVRDHSQPCEHYERAGVGYKEVSHAMPDFWVCPIAACPGGREMVFKPTDYLPDELFAMQESGGLWVEVTDE